MHNISAIDWTLSKWLAVKTDGVRDQLVEEIGAHDPSLRNDNYRGLLAAHDQFRGLVKPVYRDPILQRMFAKFLPERRHQLVQGQSQIIQLANGDRTQLRSKLPSGLVPRMGWLYAAEFVDRGLAQLAETAQKNDIRIDVDLTEYNRLWTAFRSELDQLELSESEEERLVNGAISALSLYCGLLARSAMPI